MKQGTTWIKWALHDENDNFVWLTLKVAYEYEAGWFEDGVYNEKHQKIEVLEYPENITDEIKAKIDAELPDILDYLLDDVDESERDFDNYYEAKRDEKINNYIDNQKEQ